MIIRIPGESELDERGESDVYERRKDHGKQPEDQIRLQTRQDGFQHGMILGGY